MQQERIKSMVVKQQPTTDFNNHLDAWHKKYSVWAETCRRYGCDCMSLYHSTSYHLPLSTKRHSVCSFATAVNECTSH